MYPSGSSTAHAAIKTALIYRGKIDKIGLIEFFSPQLSSYYGLTEFWAYMKPGVLGYGSLEAAKVCAPGLGDGGALPKLTLPHPWCSPGNIC